MGRDKLSIVALRFGSPYSFDGVNNSIYVLAEAFLELGHQVYIVGGLGSNPGSDELIRFFDVEKIPAAVTLGDITSFRLKLWERWICKGSKILRVLDPDITIANGVIPVLRIGFRILRIHDVPQKLHHRIATRILMKRYHCFVFSSSTIKDEFLAKLQADKSKCFIIPLPINLRRYRTRPLSKRERAILFVDGRRRRNLHLALEIFDYVSKLDKDAIMYVVGTNKIPEGDYSRTRVIPLGFISREALRNLYSRVRLLLMPTSYEGFGYPVLETFASGTPVIGSGELPKELLVEGYNGFRVESYTPKEYVEKILLLLSHEKLWRKMSRNALMTASKCDSLNVAKCYIELYKRFKGVNNVALNT